MSSSISACLGLKRQRWERRWDYRTGRRSLLGPLGTFTKLTCERVSEMWSESLSLTQSCLTLYNSMDCSPAGSSVHRIFQARVLEWVAIPFSRGSSQPRDRTQVSCIVSRFFTIWATREVIILPTTHNGTNKAPVIFVIYITHISKRDPKIQLCLIH